MCRSGIRGLYVCPGRYTIGALDAWTFIWLMFLLKIPIVALFLIVRWAVRAVPETPGSEDGGIGPAPRPLHPHHPRSRLPRQPRRGPHGEPPLAPPRRVRVAATAGRLARP
jgi:hypothetical protein